MMNPPTEYSIQTIDVPRKKVAIGDLSNAPGQEGNGCFTDDEILEEQPPNPSGQPSLRSMRTDRSSTSASYLSFEGRSKTSAVLQTSKSVLYGRMLFVFVLMAAAASMGYVAYRLISDSEHLLASERFESVAKRALSTAQLVIEEKKKATDSLALMMASTNPDAEAWPNVYMEGFEQVSSSLGIVTEGSLSFCPIVIPGGEEQASFEAFAYDLFRNIQRFPQETGVSDFGEGIFSFGEGEFGNETWSDGRFHITSGWTYHYSQQNILVPFLQSDSGPHDVLMLNIHFEHHRAEAIDNVITCSEERSTSMDLHRECGSMTDLMWSETAAKIEPGPAGLMIVPIYPRNDNRTLTGFIVGKQIWHDLLKHGFESDVDGVDVVLRTANVCHTYRVVKGNVTHLGEGTAYLNPNSRFSLVGRHINPNFFSNITVNYYMDVYSNQDFYKAYSTNNARTACIGAVLIIVCTSLLFFFYDYFVRKEFHDKRKLLQAKRQFVRFVSHEVRTPLNTVCMGLTLLQHDFASALGLRRSNGESGPIRKIAADHDKMDTEKLQEWILLSTQVYQNAENAVHVLSDLLNYDKIQMGTLTLELSLVSILHSLEKTINEFKLAALESKVKLQLDVSPLLSGDTSSQDVEFAEFHVHQLPADIRDAKVVADNVRLAQVFRNLLSNGLKFSNENGNLRVRVSISTFSNGKQRRETVMLHKEGKVDMIQRGIINIEMIDEGVGMTPEQVKTVFNDGTQFNANQFQAGGGSGLGLSIAKGIVMSHGGKLSCSSRGMGLGTTFHLSLPLYDPVDTVSHTNRTLMTKGKDVARNVADADSGVPQLYILVVDDSLTNRKLCMRLLERNGHTCEGASDGDEAVIMVTKSLAGGKPYDCILMDYEMPKMNGPEACERMRNLGCSSYIAGVTGNLLSEDVDHFRNCGANWVFPKPFRMEALEEQWIEDGVTPYTEQEASCMIRVESEGHLAEIDDVAKAFVPPV